VMSQNDLESTGSNSGGALTMVKSGEPSKTSTRR
jgi:hypothetical protein